MPELVGTSEKLYNKVDMEQSPWRPFDDYDCTWYRDIGEQQVDDSSDENTPRQNSRATQRQASSTQSPPTSPVHGRGANLSWKSIARTPAYIPAPADVGHRLRVRLRPTNRNKNSSQKTTYLETGPVMAFPAPPKARSIRKAPAPLPRPPSTSVAEVETTPRTIEIPDDTVERCAKLGLTTYRINSSMLSAVFPDCPRFALFWEYRRNNILRELLYYNTTFICLQEVAKAHYYDFFEPQLLMLAGYKGVWQATSINVGRPVGSATFWKMDKYTLKHQFSVPFDMTSGAIKPAQRPKRSSAASSLGLSVLSDLGDRLSNALNLNKHLSSPSSARAGREGVPEGNKQQSTHLKAGNVGRRSSVHSRDSWTPDGSRRSRSPVQGQAAWERRGSSASANLDPNKLDPQQFSKFWLPALVTELELVPKKKDQQNTAQLEARRNLAKELFASAGQRQPAAQSPNRADSSALSNSTLVMDVTHNIQRQHEERAGPTLVLVNVHIPKARNPHVKLAQAKTIIDHVQRHIAGQSEGASPGPASPITPACQVRQETHDVEQKPVILCGEFSSTYEAASYKFLAQGRSPMKHPPVKHVNPNSGGGNMEHALALDPDSVYTHNLHIESAYNTVFGQEPIITTANLQKCVQPGSSYVWYTPSALQCVSMLQVPTEECLPNASYSSDDHALVVEFALKGVPAGS